MKDVYVITGGGGGMGMATARRLGSKGSLLLADVKAESLDWISAELRAQQVECETIVCDVTDRASIEALAAKAKSMGRLAALVHTAGLSPALADAERIMLVNLVGTALLYEAFDPLFEKGSVVVSLSSSSIYHIEQNPEAMKIMPALRSILENPLSPDFMEKVAPFMPDEGAAYGMSKYGVYRYSQKLSYRLWREKGTRIVTLAPGNIITPMGMKELEKWGDFMEHSNQITPLGRMGDADEVAKVIEFLCSDGASYIAGVDVLVDGGMVAMIHREWQRLPTPGLPLPPPPSAPESKAVVQVKDLFQSGIVVRDLKKSIQLYEGVLGIGPWEEMRISSEMFRSMTYKGKPVEKATFLTGTATVGNLQIELIQPVEGDLPYTDFLNEHGEGLHHMGHVQVSDMDAAVRDLEAQGYPCIFAGATQGVSFAYVDMSKSLGMIVELLKMG